MFDNLSAALGLPRDFLNNIRPFSLYQTLQPSQPAPSATLPQGGLSPTPGQPNPQAGQMTPSLPGVGAAPGPMPGPFPGGPMPGGPIPPGARPGIPGPLGLLSALLMGRMGPQVPVGMPPGLGQVNPGQMLGGDTSLPLANLSSAIPQPPQLPPMPPPNMVPPHQQKRPLRPARTPGYQG